MNEEIIKAFSEMMESFFKKDTRRKINWEARKRATTALKNPLATQ